MEMTWKLVPNATWHDGTPFTADDLVLGWQYARGPGSLLAPQWRRVTAGASAPDPVTFVVQFSQIYARGIEGDFRAMPKHILGDVFEAGDVDRINNHPYFTTEMIGLGPYRLVQWQQGSSMELARFPNYYSGRPKLDGVVARFYQDTNTLMANIFAGELDLVLPNILQVEQIEPLEQAFRGSRNRVIVHSAGQWQYVQSQFRPEVAKPRALLDRRVREALYRGLDRQTLSEVMTRAKGPVADSWIPPEDPRRQTVFKDAIPQYPFDPTRAMRDLEEIGFRRGPDGILITPDGERFEQELRKTPIPTAEIQLGIMRDSWRKMGVETVPLIMPAALTGDPAYRASYPGWDISLQNWTNAETQIRSTPPRPGVAWDNGGGRSGYVNREIDALIDRLNMTLLEDARDRIHAELLRQQMTDLPRLYMWWEVFVVTMSGRVKGANPPFFLSYWGWDAFEWDID
jgi:peptide/nickel transport system substrate-binding protein